MQFITIADAQTNMGLDITSASGHQAFTVTSQIRLADTVGDAMYSIGTQYAAFIVAIIMLLIVIGLVAGVFHRVWGWIANLGH